MKNLLAACLLVFSLDASLAAANPVPPEDRTIYHHAEKSWAVGVIHLGKALTFRDGKVLAFPAQISELVWAPNQTKPRNLMLVHEVRTSDKEPFLKEGDVIFAPIRLLPVQSYWKDNLPQTRRHEIAGSRRYAFRGEQLEPVKQVLGAYLTAGDIKGMERWSAQLAAVSRGLNAGVPILREDSAHYLAIYPTLARDIDQKAMPDIAKYLSSEAPAAEKANVIEALASAKVDLLKPVLADLAKRDDATGAAALAGMEKWGESVSTDRLIELSRSSSVEMQTYAAEALSRRAGTDEAAFSRVKEMIANDKADAGIAVAAVNALATVQGDKVADLLIEAVRRGGSYSRPAAVALGQNAGPRSSAALIEILEKEKGEAAIAAAAGVSAVQSCPDCRKALLEQHTRHPDETVRNLIGVILGVPLEHKH